jgi:hypothetical protein
VLLLLPAIRWDFSSASPAQALKIGRMRATQVVLVLWQVAKVERAVFYEENLVHANRSSGPACAFSLLYILGQATQLLWPTYMLDQAVEPDPQ